MFTPEFINEERGEFLLVANHGLASPGIDKTQYCIQYSQNMLGTIATSTAHSNLPGRL